MTTTQAKWLERIQQWQASGVRAEQFTKDKEYRPSTLVWYRTELKRLGLLDDGAERPDCSVGGQRNRGSAGKLRGVGGGRNTRRGDKKAKSSAAVGVSIPIAKVLRSTSVVPHVDAVVIELGLARIRVQQGFDAGLLQKVVHALQGAA